MRARGARRYRPATLTPDGGAGLWLLAFVALVLLALAGAR